MYVITGATGNTGKLIVESLLQANQVVTAVSRDEKNLQNLVNQGAKPAVGSLEDVEFLTQTFQGAKAIYALIPPKWDLQEPWRNYQRKVATALTEAIRRSGVQNVVLLSSNGAQLPEGAGPVTGLYEFEQMLQKIDGLNVMSLRAGFFMQNLYGVIGMIKGMGIFGYTLRKDLAIPVVHTNDIAAVATQQLLELNFKGFHYVFVPGQRDVSMGEIAEVLGKAIGKPDLQYIQFSPADAKAGMLQAGLPETIADGYNELFNALNEGPYLNDYQRTPENTNPTSIEDFAKEFALAYQHS